MTHLETIGHTVRANDGRRIVPDELTPDIGG